MIVGNQPSIDVIKILFNKIMIPYFFQVVPKKPQHIILHLLPRVGWGSLGQMELEDSFYSSDAKPV